MDVDVEDSGVWVMAVCRRAVAELMTNGAASRPKTVGLKLQFSGCDLSRSFGAAWV
jgi:hypothetical protein